MHCFLPSFSPNLAACHQLAYSQAELATAVSLTCRCCGSKMRRHQNSITFSDFTSTTTIDLVIITIIMSQKI